MLYRPPLMSTAPRKSMLPRSTKGEAVSAEVSPLISQNLGLASPLFFPEKTGGQRAVTPRAAPC